MNQMHPFAIVSKKLTTLMYLLTATCLMATISCTHTMVSSVEIDPRNSSDDEIKVIDNSEMMLKQEDSAMDSMKPISDGSNEKVVGLSDQDHLMSDSLEHESQMQENTKTDNAMAPQNSCKNAINERVNKKVSVLGFSIQSPANAVDLSPLHTLLPKELTGKLSELNSLVAIDSTTTQLPGKSHRQGFAIALKDLQLKDNSQYSVIGNIVSTAYNTDESIFDKLKNKQIPWKQIRGQKPRIFSISLTVIDNFTGLEVAHKQFSGSAYDSTSLKNKPQAFSAAFYDTDYGQVVSEIVTQAARWINDSLLCLPTKARITQISNNGVTLNIGRDVNVETGMIFKVDSRGEQSLPDFIQQTDPHNGAEIVITQVYENQSFARYIENLANFQVYINDQAQLIR